MKVYKVKYKDCDNYNVVSIVSANTDKEAVDLIINSNYTGFKADFYTEELKGLYTLNGEPEIMDCSEYK